MDDISIYFIQWLTLAAVNVLAVMSPGPDFVMAVRNSVVYSRRVGVFTALGFSIGVLVHVTYTVLGIAAIIAQSVMAFNIIKYAGAAYLIWIGYHALRSKGMKTEIIDGVLIKTGVKQMGDFAAFRSGFLTNLLNPKAALFFLAIVSQIIRPETPLFWQAVYGLTCSVITMAWFSAIAFVLTQGRVRNTFLKATKWIDRACGSLMIALGIKVALTTR